MLLDLWEWFLLINDGIDLVFSNLASGTYPIPLSFVLVFTVFALISYFAWRSTDIPDLPPAPRPPYVIQITAGPGSGGLRQTIADVRLLSGGAFFDGSEILTRYQNISRNQATNTESNAQPSTSGAASNRNIEGRNSLGDTSVAGQNLRRRTIPARSLLLGLFRRPNPLTRPVPTVSNAIRAQLGSPNLVVYHRVNVYHHHIHSHPTSNQNSSNPPANPTNISSNQNQDTVDSGTSTSSSVPQPPSTTNTATANSPVLPESSSISETSRLHENQRVAQSVSNSSENFDHTSVDNGDSTVGGRGSFSAVHNQREASPIPNSNLEPVSVNMPARSGGGSSQRQSNDGCNSSTYAQHAPGTMNPPASDGEDVRFTIKFLNDTQMDVTSQLSEKIADFKRRHFATEMSENKTVRLIFNGRVLDNDNKTLREFGIFEQCVVHCLIVNRQQNQDQSRGGGVPSNGRNGNGNQADGVQGNVRRMVGLPEPGMFFVAFIGIFLIFLWFICLHFGQHLFTQSAVISLTVLTAIFLIGIVACYLPLPTN